MQTDEDLPCPDFRSEALRLLSTFDQNYSNNAESDKLDKSDTAVCLTETTIEETKEIIVEATNNDDKNAAQNVSEDMNVDVSDSVSVDNNGVEINTDKTNTITSGSSESAKIDSSENMSIDANSNQNNSNENTEKKRKGNDENEFSAKDMTAKHYTVSVGSKDTNQKDITENTLEQVASSKNNNSTIGTERSNYIDNYDVQNKIENEERDENIAVNAAQVPLPDDLDQSSDEKQDNSGKFFTITVK